MAAKKRKAKYGSESNARIGYEEKLWLAADNCAAVWTRLSISMSFWG